MFRKCYTIVSDLALCQRCPFLLAYKIHRHKRTAWSVGIHGNGNAYGTIFHENIARVFFEAASDRENYLHEEMLRSIIIGGDSLEDMIRENIFMPFVANKSQNFSSGQILAMASGVSVWVKAMNEFFDDIPSLKNFHAENISSIFITPEQKLQSHYDFGDNRLVITGRYDAMLFNPDKAEARLFEFKGYSKSDITVPLSQSLIYAWLVAKRTGIIPSVEIIYLDEENSQPDIFSSHSVRNMIIAGLPGLFETAFNVISLKSLPEISHDKELCSVCRFSNTCESDRLRNFKRGSSLISVLIFFMLVLLMTAQVFFVTGRSTESLTEEVELANLRQGLEDLVREGRNHLVPNSNHYPELTYQTFGGGAEVWSINRGKYNAIVYDLNYRAKTGTVFKNIARNVKMPYRIFSPMPGAYLIRAFAEHDVKHFLMLQVLVSGDKELLHHEIWYDE